MNISRHDPSRTAIVHSTSQRKFTYGELLGDVAAAQERLSQIAKSKSLAGERVAFLVENSYDYVGRWTLLLHVDAVLIVPSTFAFNSGARCRGITTLTVLSGKRTSIHPREQRGRHLAVI